MRAHVRDGERSQGEKALATSFLPVLSLVDFTRGLIAFHSLSLPPALFSALPEYRCVVSRAIRRCQSSDAFCSSLIFEGCDTIAEIRAFFRFLAKIEDSNPIFFQLFKISISLKFLKGREKKEKTGLIDPDRYCQFK